jgi:hypothetical protein
LENLNQLQARATSFEEGEVEEDGKMGAAFSCTSKVSRLASVQVQRYSFLKDSLSRNESTIKLF